MYESDHRTVMTLDAGGTNFVFSAIRGCQEILSPYRLPAITDHLEHCLEQIVSGFTATASRLSQAPAAISFAFPGPADYRHGIIGDLPNLPCFRGGVALGPYLEEKFGIPVYINNDGNLFAYGEALSGALPAINAEMERRGLEKRYRNLLGITLGTGFGAGVVIDNVLLDGDNGCGGDVWLMQNRKYPDLILEESVSIRAVLRVYEERSGQKAGGLQPRDLFDIAEGLREGNRAAAVQSFRELGEMAGTAIVNALDIMDGIVVLGGGLANAHKYILPGLMKEAGKKLGTFSGASFPALEMKLYNLQDAAEREAFYRPAGTWIDVPYSGRKVLYDSSTRSAVILSELGASRAIALGAYTYALHRLDHHKES